MNGKYKTRSDVGQKDHDLSNSIPRDEIGVKD